LTSLVLASWLAILPQEAPVLQVVSPQPEAYVSGQVTLEARLVPLAAERRITRMSFFADGVDVCTVTRRPYTCLWNAGKLVKPHQVRVVVELEGGARLVQTVRTRGVGYTETAGVSAVAVPAVVVDGRGRFVKGLTPADFSVAEAKAPQRITGFAAEQTDVTLALAIDTSGSMEGTLEAVKGHAKEFLRHIPPTWPTTVMSFDHRIFTVAAPEASAEERAQGIDALKPWGGTALYTTVLRALERVAGAPARKAIVVFTDGDDQSSAVDASEVRRAIEENDAVVYFVAAGKAASDGPTVELLEELALISGGRVLRTKTDRSLQEAFAEVREEIRNQYLLTYVPERLAAPGTWRTLTVRAACRSCRVRARTGYRVAADR
jgi:VWFA-related protein